MATLLETPPDKIEQRGIGAYLFYFADGKDITMLPIGAEYTVIYSPVGYTGNWCAALFRVVRTPLGKPKGMRVDIARPLEPDEIAHFDALIENTYSAYL